MKDSYSLSEVCELIGESLQLTMPESFRVRAEISSLSTKGGHCYMELAEKTAESSNLFAAKLRAVCWSNVWAMISAYFFQETGRELQVGMQVLVEASVSFHPVFGLSLQISGIDPSYTLGNIVREKQATIERLTKEGVIDMQHALAISEIPQRIAVISSADAAGYGDFCCQLRDSGYSFTTKLFPAIVQGDKAASSVIDALGKIYDEIESFDAVALIRGGGASTDLSCFDNYDMCACIAQFPLPVITGIGHQRDISVADMVAYQSVKTPTATAEYFVSFMQKASERLRQLIVRLNNTADKRILKQQERISILQLRIQNAVRQYVVRQNNRLEIIDKTIAAHSPEDIFRRGYALVRKDGKIVHNAATLISGDIIETQFAEGRTKSQVM